MISFKILLAATGLLGLIFLALTANVLRQRYATRTILGDGNGEVGKQALYVAVRSHANFAEYVPLSLLLIGGVSFAGAGPHLVLGLCMGLVAARIMHPFGMVLPAPNVLRGGGMVLNWAVLAVASVMGILLAV